MAALPSRRQRIQEALKSPYVRAVLDMIAAAEIGQDANNAQRGYNVAFGKNATFDSYAAHPGVRGEYIDKQGQRRTSSAAGRYQFLEGTVRDLQKRYGFSDFSPQTQDEMAVALMMDAGALDDILRGDLMRHCLSSVRGGPHFTPLRRVAGCMARGRLTSCTVLTTAPWRNTLTVPLSSTRRCLPDPEVLVALHSRREALALIGQSLLRVFFYRRALLWDEPQYAADAGACW